MNRARLCKQREVKRGPGITDTITVFAKIKKNDTM